MVVVPTVVRVDVGLVSDPLRVPPQPVVQLVLRLPAVSRLRGFVCAVV